MQAQTSVAFVSPLSSFVAWAYVSLSCEKTSARDASCGLPKRVLRPCYEHPHALANEEFEPVSPGIGRVEAPHAGQSVVPGDLDPGGLEARSECVELGSAFQPQRGVRLPRGRELGRRADVELAVAEP